MELSANYAKGSKKTIDVLETMISDFFLIKRQKKRVKRLNSYRSVYYDLKNFNIDKSNFRHDFKKAAEKTAQSAE